LHVQRERNWAAIERFDRSPDSMLSEEISSLRMDAWIASR
jgi:hypothetical protein